MVGFRKLILTSIGWSGKDIYFTVLQHTMLETQDIEVVQNIRLHPPASEVK